MNNVRNLEKPFSELCVISEDEKTFQGNIQWKISNQRIKSYLKWNKIPISSNTFSVGSPSYCSFRFLIYAGEDVADWLMFIPLHPERYARDVHVCIMFDQKLPDCAWIKVKLHFVEIGVYKTFNISKENFHEKIEFGTCFINENLSYLSINNLDLTMNCSIKISVREVKCAVDKKKVSYRKRRDFKSDEEVLRYKSFSDVVKTKGREFPSHIQIPYFQLFSVDKDNDGESSDCNSSIESSIETSDIEAFKYESLSDVSISIKGRQFVTHKTLLAQIPYFQELFDANESEQCFELTDIDPDIFNHVLTFLYSGDIPELDFKLACELYIVASDLRVLHLKYLCSSYLGANLSERNVTIVLKLSQEYQDSSLKRECFKFIKKANVETLTEKSIML